MDFSKILSGDSSECSSRSGYRKMDFSKILSRDSSECSSRSGYTSGTNDSTSTSSMTDGSSTTTTTTSQQSMDCDYSTTCTSTGCHRRQQYDHRGRPIGVVSSPLALFFSCMTVPCLAAPPPPGSRGGDESASSASSVTSSIVAQARHKSARKARTNSQRYNRPTSPAWLSRHVANTYYEEKKRLNTPYNFNRN